MIKGLIEEAAANLKAPKDLDPRCILWALYFNEKYDSRNRTPRYEKSYAPGGYYYEHSEEVRKEYAEWGASAACSYSNFQILYITAREVGYDGPPLALDRDSIALPFVTKLLNVRIFAKGAKTPEEVADAYNSGSYQDSYKPAAYIRKFVRNYKKCLTLMTSKPDDSAT